MGISVLRSFRSVVLIWLCGLLVSMAGIGQVLQSAGQGGGLWASRDGAVLRVGGAGRGRVQVELPPGASIRDLEPTANGWLAAGRLPSGSGSDLLLIEAGKAGVDLLPVPARGPTRYRGQPVLLLDEGHLTGLAWAAGEGPRELEIWAAAWRDGEWSPPELVSPVGPGSQVAPTGVVLEDGSWLLVWTAFDGQDSEIVFSRRVEERWTSPEPIHEPNEVPDVTPDVVSIVGGALVAWSWFDGNDYRLKSARWLDGRWREAQAFGGKGSGEPRFFETSDRILLLFSAVEPKAWSVFDLDQTGRRRRQAVVFEDTYERPLLLLGESAAGVLRWPSADRNLEWRELP